MYCWKGFNGFECICKIKIVIMSDPIQYLKNNSHKLILQHALAIFYNLISQPISVFHNIAYLLYEG